VWLLTGEGDMLINEEKHEQMVKSIPLIPHAAFAGYGNYQFPDLQIEDFYQIREFQNASFLLRVSGDSMAPKYNGGSLIACQKVERISFWQWHRIYAICTKNQGILIKRVEESENDDEIICLSENPNYRPFRLGKDEIVSVALVMGAIVLE
jgi:phage repressor protein C with HTH and peptisase S24 domain